MGDFVERVVKIAQERLGKTGSLTTLSSKPDTGVKEWISTGSLALNRAIGRPGIPVGRLTSINGIPSTGKTTIITHILAETQKMGGVGILGDTEHSFYPDRAKRIGVDAGNLIICQDETVEDVFKSFWTTIEVLRAEGLKGVIAAVWDSFSQTPTRSEYESDPGTMTGQKGEHSLILSRQLRKFTDFIDENQVALVIVNQKKDRPDFRYGTGGGKTYLGYKPITYASHLMLDVGYAKTLKDKSGRAYAIQTHVRVSKNKVAPPFREAEIIIDDDGIDESAYLINQVGVPYELLRVKGGGWCEILNNTLLEEILCEYNSRLPESERLALGGISRSMQQKDLVGCIKRSGGVRAVFEKVIGEGK